MIGIDLPISDLQFRGTEASRDKNVAMQNEIEVKCAMEMVDGRLDMLKGDLIKDFKQEENEEEAGAGSFGIFTNPGKPGTGSG